MADEKDDQSKLEGYKQDFYDDFSATEEQRDKSNEELRFAMVAGGQWEGFLEDAFESRAKIELDQTADYLYRTYAQWTEHRIGVHYAPDDERSTDDDAELLDGLFRRDLRRRNGQSSVDTAVFEAMACGTGAFHLSTEYEDDEDPENKDQCVVFSDLANAYSTVAWDSSARRRDKADAQRCTILIPHSPDGFKRKYPDAVPDSSLQPQDRRWFNWSSPQIVYEAIRYEVRVENEVAFTYGHPETQDMVRLSDVELKEEGDELKAAGYVELSKKRIKRRNVYRTTFCGGSVLEAERRIAGKYIPVIPMYGYAAHIDGVDYWHGVIRKRIDGQRLVNMAASLMAETASTASEDKPIFTAEQMQNVKQHWAADRHQKPYLLADPIRHPDTGEIQHVGPVGMLPGSSQALAAQTLLATVMETITRGTGGAPQDTMDTDASGKAINAVLKRVDMNTQPIFENIKTAMAHCGEVYRHIAAEVYAERTRTVNIVTQAGEMQRRTLLQAQAKGGQIIYENDTSKGRFEVIVETGPNYQTQREAAVEGLKDILNSPQLAPGDPLGRIILQRIIEMLPAQGMDDIKAYVRRQLLLAGVRKPETDEDMATLQEASQNLQPDPQAELLTAAAQNQRTQAAERIAKIKDLGASADAKHASATLDLAKARETLMNIGAHQRAAVGANVLRSNQGMRQPLRLVPKQ